MGNVLSSSRDLLNCNRVNFLDSNRVNFLNCNRVNFLNCNRVNFLNCNRVNFLNCPSQYSFSGDVHSSLHSRLSTPSPGHTDEPRCLLQLFHLAVHVLCVLIDKHFLWFSCRGPRFSLCFCSLLFHTI